MKLIDEQALATLADVREQLAHFQLSETARERVFNQASDQALRVYVFLTDQPDQLLKHGFSAADVLCSRYYWLRRYIHLFQAAHRRDAGPADFEQIAFQIVESCEWTSDENFDWARFEQAHAKAIVDVEALVRDGRV